MRSQLRPNITGVNQVFGLTRILSLSCTLMAKLKMFLIMQCILGRLDGQVKVCQPILLGSMNLHLIMAIYSGYVYEKL